MPGISMREKDGIKIITLEGSDFFAYVTNPYLNNSELYTQIYDSKLNTNNVAELWKKLEKGVTTWSGCMINQDESKSTIGPNGIGLGFSSIHPSQIIAMSTTDANVSHATRQLEVTTENGNEIQFQYSKQFMEETEKRIEGETQYRDLTHTYNGVASHRRTQELSTIKPNTYGGKTMEKILVNVESN